MLKNHKFIKPPPPICCLMKTNRGLLLNVTVAIGGFLQGWVCVLLIGHFLYMKEQLKVELELKRDLLLMAVPFIGLLLALTSSRIGRRPLLVFMSLLYLFSSVVMLWSEDIPLLLVARFLDGFAWGFSHLLIMCYLLEFAPWSVWRVCLPQLTCFCGVCLCLLVAQVLATKWLSWRIIFWVAFCLSLVYFILVVFYLPESPRWLVSKERNDEASQVLQTLHGRKDVSDEMHLLVYGDVLVGATSIEDEMHILVHGHRLEGATSIEDDDLEYGRPQDLSSENLNKPVTLSSASEQRGSMEIQKNTTFMDSLPTHSDNGKADGDSLTRGDDLKSNAADVSVLTTRVDG